MAVDFNYEYLDDVTCIIYLEMPAANVVFLQGIFETYEGLGTVRTLSLAESLVCVLTTRELFEDCANLLYAERDLLHWRPVAIPPEPQRSKYLGYGKALAHIGSE